MRSEQGDSRKGENEGMIKGKTGEKGKRGVEGPRVTGSVLPSICCRP